MLVNVHCLVSYLEGGFCLEFTSLSLLLCLWSKHCGHSSGFARKMLFVMLRLAETAQMIGRQEVSVSSVVSAALLQQ